MSLTMLGDLAVFWLYVTLICSFFTLHYIHAHRCYSHRDICNRTEKKNRKP